MRNKRLILCIILVLCVSMILPACSSNDAAGDENGAYIKFSEWNQDGVINDIVEYVTDVTDEDSSNYIPEEDRIAVFDLDGTLVGEQAPIYFEWMLYTKRVLDDSKCEATQEMKDLAAQILQTAMNRESIPENIEEDESIMFGAAFDKMPVDDYKKYVASFLEQEADGFDGLTYGTAYFRPMVQVLSYLNEKHFTIYICSGTDRDADRVLMDQFFHIPYYHVIGTDCYSEGSNHDDVNYLEYQYDEGEKIMRDDTRIIKNVKASKITQMYQEIGQQPVLAFGNSSGDYSMFTYTASNEKYRTEVFCLVPDDDEREYANMEKAEKLTATCEKNDWHVISMKNDFLSVYGDKVVKNPDNKAFAESLYAKYESEISLN